MNISRGLERLYAPQWAGGWTATRGVYVLACLATQLPRLSMIEDAYAPTDMVFSKPPFHLADHLVLSPNSGMLVWAAGVLGLLMLGWGGRLARPGLLLWLAASWLLLAAEAFNIKAYDRVITWIGLALFFAPIGERGLTEAWRSPFARWVLILFYMALYGSTGWLKALEGSTWWTGDVLAWHLVDHWFGGSSLGAWISGQRWLYLPMQWFTVVFEVGFPLAILIRRLNPIWLAAGVLLHIGIWSTMNVGPFSFVALAGYPVLLHPELARGAWARIRALRPTRSDASPAR